MEKINVWGLLVILVAVVAVYKLPNMYMKKYLESIQNIKYKTYIHDSNKKYKLFNVINAKMLYLSAVVVFCIVVTILIWYMQILSGDVQTKNVLLFILGLIVTIIVEIVYLNGFYNIKLENQEISYKKLFEKQYIKIQLNNVDKLYMENSRVSKQQNKGVLILKIDLKKNQHMEIRIPWFARKRMAKMLKELRCI